MSTGVCRAPPLSTATPATWQLSTLPSRPHHCRAEVLGFFAVRRLGEVFDSMDELGAECWRARFEATADLPTAAASHDNTRRLALQRPRDPAFITLQRVVRQAAILIHRN